MEGPVTEEKVPKSQVIIPTYVISFLDILFLDFSFLTCLDFDYHIGSVI